MAAPTVLNAANEIAVAAFLSGEIGFPGIPALVAAALEAADGRGILRAPASVDHALEIDREARDIARGLLRSNAAGSH